MTETAARPQDHGARRRDPDADAWIAYLGRKREECLALVGRAFSAVRASSTVPSSTI